MNLTDRIHRNLVRHGPATATDIAMVLKESAKNVAGALSNMAKQQRVRPFGQYRQGKRGPAATVYEAVI